MDFSSSAHVGLPQSNIPKGMSLREVRPCASFCTSQQVVRSSPRGQETITKFLLCVTWNFLSFLSQTSFVCVCVVLEPSQLQVASARIVVMGGFFFQAHASSFVSLCRVLASTELHGTKFPVHQHVLQRGTILV